MTILGSSNVFDLDFESDDDTFNWEITGDSNNLNVLMKDGAHTQTVDWTGDGGILILTKYLEHVFLVLVMDVQHLIQQLF